VESRRAATPFEIFFLIAAMPNSPQISRRRAVQAAALAIAAPGAAFAQAEWPTHPVRVVVPSSPGGGTDTFGRILAQALTEQMKQSFIVDNKPGASGNIGAQQAMRAAPDGHTLMMTTNPFTNNVSLFKNLPYDPQKSFTPIVYVGHGHLGLVVHPSVPAKNTKEFIEYLKAHPGELNYGSPGNGTPHHLAMELFKHTTKTDLKHVPYRGSAGATQDITGGHVSAGFQAIHVIKPIAEAGHVQLLAAGSKERVKIAPELPTLQEEGLAGFEVDLWYGMLLPAGTPRAVVMRYNKEINEILRLPAVVDKLGKQGLTVVGGSPEQFADFIAKETAKWQLVVKEAGIETQ
jgi:tripartite-type tricarboxylate transporter receptor subunit TctC